MLWLLVIYCCRWLALMPPNQIFKISGQIGQISGHLVNSGHFRTLFKISGISGPRSGLLHSLGFHGAPSCAICLVCLHSGLANTSLHHIYIGGRKVRHESLHNFPITPLLSSADNPTPEIRTSLVTCWNRWSIL